MEVTFAKPAEAGCVVRLIRQELGPRLCPLTPYGTAGASRYVGMCVAARPESSATVFTVAKEEGECLGCAELHVTAQGLHLNHISVRPSLRGRGVGLKLLAASLRLLAPRAGSGALLRLDVSADNRRAASWYRRLGLRRETAFGWYLVAEPRTTPPPAQTAFAHGIAVSDLPQADIIHAAFGFSQFTLADGANRYVIGRLGSAWYRLADTEIASNTAVLAALQVLAPRRRIALIARPRLRKPLWPEVAHGWGMEAPLVAVMRKLAVAAGSG